MASEAISYDKSELRAVIRAFKAMDDEAVNQAKAKSSALAEYAADRIKSAAAGRQKAGAGVMRIAEGVKISKSSKVGEFSYGFAGQKFSGGGDTKTLWAGLEFGSKKFKQFPTWSGRQGKGGRGYFIYPTLREIQPQLVQQWEEAFDKILKEW